MNPVDAPFTVVPRLVETALLIPLLFAGPAAAQQARSVVVRVGVADSSGVALADVDVSLVEGVGTTIGRGKTTGSNRIAFTVPRASGDYQIVARKIGFLPGFRFFSSASANDTLTLAMSLTRAPTQLAPVNVTAS